jgi:hypothetical protein
MERLLSPCTRLRDQLESQGLHEQLIENGHEPLQELNLNVYTEELLSPERAFTYADLYALVVNRDTAAWLTPHAAVVRGAGRAMRYWEQLGESYRFIFNADGKAIFALARSTEHLLEICDVVVRLLAVSVVHSLQLHNWSSLDLSSINAPNLACLMEQCQSLNFLSLMDLEMDENHCRALGAYSKPGLAIVLSRCKLTNAGATALAEILGRNEGQTLLNRFQIDNSVLADGLRGNNRLKFFTPRFSSSLEVHDQEFLAIAGAVEENKGLVHLDLSDSHRVSDEMWGAICDSLEKHPTLEVLDLRTMGAIGIRGIRVLAPAMLKSRIQALLNMMKMNMSIQTIRLHSCHNEHELFRGSVIPYLMTNRFRPRVRAIQKIRPIAYRTKVLGQALLAARTDANRFWMILSGNAEVAFPSTTTPAANLATPVTTAAAASSTANDADVAASVMPALTTTATGSLSKTAAAATNATSIAPNIATPSAGLKRKARP